MSKKHTRLLSPAVTIAMFLVATMFVGMVYTQSIPQVPSGAWTLASNSMASARAGSAAALLPGGGIMLTGGTSSGGSLASVEIFGGSFATPMVHARSRHIAVTLKDGRVLVSGGETGGVTASSAEIFDPTSGSWSPVGNMTEPRAGHTASVLPDGRVFIAGGEAGGNISQTAEVFDAATMTFSYVGLLSMPRRNHAASVLTDGRVLITGGSFGGSVPTVFADVFDPAINAVTPGPAMIVPREKHTATTLMNGSVLVVGGSDGSNDLDSAELFDPATGIFTPAGSLAAPRSGHLAFLLPNNNSVLFAGGSSATASTELFVPDMGAVSGSFQPTGALSTARFNASGSPMHQDGQLLIAGGKDANGHELASGELYGFATVKTDKDDYAPGTIVTISGKGWTPGETVTFMLREIGPYTDMHPSMTSVADANGNVVNTEFSPDIHDLNILFILTATGSESHQQAQSKFTDAISVGKINTVGAQTPIPVVGGNSATYAVSITFNGSGATCSAAMAIGSPGLPSGASASFSPNPVPSTNPSTVLTVTTTAGITPVASSSFQITAAGSGCSGIGLTGTGGGNPSNPTLNVSKAVSTTTFGTAPGPTYLGGNFTVSASNDSGGSITYSRVSGPCTLVSGSTFSSSGAGSCVVQADSAATSFYLTSSAQQAVTIAKATPTITWANPADIVYGTALSGGQLNATASTAGSFAYTPISATRLNAGSAQILHVDFTATDTVNYNNASKDVSINVTKAHLVVKADDKSKTYDGAAFSPFTSTITGFVNLDTAAVVTGTPAYSANATSAVNAGSYTITPSVGALSSANYDFTTFNAGTLTINKATANVVVAPYSVTYDGIPHTAMVTSITGVNGETGATVGFVSLTTTHTNAGTYTTDSWSFAGAANYKDIASTSITDTIDKATSLTTVTIASGPFTYTGSAQTPATVSVTGAGGLSLAPAADYANNTNAGNAAASYTYAGDANHNGSSDSKNFTIDKALSTTVVTIVGGPFTYTGSAQTPATVSVTGAGGLSLAPAADYANNTNAGTAEASYTYAGDANHNGSSDSKNFTIDKALSTTVVTLVGGPFTYTGSAQTPATVSVTGAGGLSLAPAADYANNTNAGTAEASYTYAGDANHNGSSDSKNFTIDKALSTTVVTIVGGPFTYTGSAQTPATVSVTGGGGMSLAPAADYANNTNAGTAAASYTYAGDANHNGSSDSKNFTIDKASSTTVVTIVGGPFTYTGSAQTPATVSVTGAGGLSLAPAADYANNTNAGTAEASYTYAGDANHNGSSDSKNFMICRADATVTVSGYTGVYDGAAHGATGTATGVGGANLSGSLDLGSTFTDVPGGTANWTFSGDANYNNQSGTAAIVIVKATPTASMTVINSPQTYTGSALAASVNVSASSVPGSVINVFTGGAATQTTAATYGVTADFVPTDTTNYNSVTGVSVGSFTINKAPSIASVTINGGPFTYTGAAQTPATVTVTGAGGLSLTPTADYVNNINAGTATARYNFYGDANHESSSDSKYFTIVKATPLATLAVSNSPQIYTGSGLAAAVSISSSSVSGSVSNILTGGAATQTTAATYAVTANFVPADPANFNSLTGISAGSFTITKATPTITWANPADITNPTLLGPTQLNATASAAGSFVYNPAAGVILGAGNAQALTVHFVPSDTINYNTPADTTVHINVLATVIVKHAPVVEDKSVVVVVRPYHNDGDDDDRRDHDEYNRRGQDGHSWNSGRDDRGDGDDRDDDSDKEWENDADGDGAVRVTLTATDIDSTKIKFNIVAPPNHGVLSRIKKLNCKPDGNGGSICTARVIYKSEPHYSGIVTFKYKANDGTNDSNEGTVTVNLVPPFTTFTQGEWGSNPTGANPGAFLAANFGGIGGVYGPAGVSIGGSLKLTFTSAAAIKTFLPAGGKAGALQSSGSNASTSKAGVLAGQVLALRLNVDFSAAGKTRAGLDAMKVSSGKLKNYTVNQVLQLANTVLGGGSMPSGLNLSISELSDIVDRINSNNDRGKEDDGFLIN